MTAAMDSTEIGRMVGTAVALGHQMVGGVGTGPAADVADAVIPPDHRRRKGAPSLRAIGAVDAIPSHPLGWCPAWGTMSRRLPGHAW
jgi:hypothetical protein